MTDDLATPSLPSALTTLQRKLADGWTSHIHGPGTGALTLGGLSDDTNGEGKRRRISRQVDVYSYALKACHPLTGRAFVAVWVHQLGDETKAGKPRWALDIAVRGRHIDEHAPQRLTAQQLAAYAASRSIAEYRAALDGLAARRAKRQATTTELSSSVPTEIEEAA